MIYEKFYKRFQFCKISRENTSISLSIIFKYDVAIRFVLLELKLLIVYYIFGKCGRDFLIDSISTTLTRI